MSHPAAACLLAYDISSPRRLLRVSRLLRQHAFWLQYSVFIGCFAPAALTDLAGQLEALMDKRQDDIRIYSLPRSCHPELIGDSPWPEGLFWADLSPETLSQVMNSSTPYGENGKKMPNEGLYDLESMTCGQEPLKRTP